MRHLPLFALLLACGTGGDPGDGGQGLPNPGYTPYDIRVEQDGLSVDLFPNQGGLGGPFARVEGDRLALYVHQCATDAPCRILRSQSTDGIEFEPAVPLLEHPEGLRDPFVTESEGQPVLWAVTEDGQRLLRHVLGESEAPKIVHSIEDGSLASPSVISADGSDHLFVLHHQDDVTSVVYRILPLSDTIITVGLCGAMPCATASRLHDLEIRRATTATGRNIWRALMSTSTGSDNSVLNFAASFDAQTWSPFAFNPAVSGNISLGSASQAVFNNRYYVFAVAGRTRTRLIAAVNARSVPSHLW